MSLQHYSRTKEEAVTVSAAPTLHHNDLKKEGLKG